MKKIILSIIVPVYKVEDYLNTCVESIYYQLNDFVELILIDDGSPDKCPQICDNWSKKIKNIKVIHKKNGGLSDARNAGINAATGQYLWFVDSDDWIGKTAIPDILSCIKEHHCDLISTQLIEVRNNNNNIYGVYPAFPDTYKVMTNLQYVKFGYPVLPSVRFIIKRELLNDNNLFFIKGVLHEDIPFCHMLIYYGKSIALIKEPTYYYRIREGSITTAPKIESCYSLVKSHKVISEFCREKSIYIDNKWFLQLTYDYFYEIFLRIYPFLGKNDYSEFMKKNSTYIRKEFNKISSLLPFKRRLLFYVFMISPKLFSTLLYLKKK